MRLDECVRQAKYTLITFGFLEKGVKSVNDVDAATELYLKRYMPMLRDQLGELLEVCPIDEDDRKAIKAGLRRLDDLVSKGELYKALSFARNTGFVQSTIISALNSVEKKLIGLV